MALSVRAASGGQNGATAVSSQAVTFPAGTTTNDLVYIIVAVNSTVSSPVAAGWNPLLTTNSTNTQSTIVCYRSIQAGDTAPTITWTTTGKASWVAVTLQPAAGQQAAHSGFGTVLNSGTAGTSFTPNSYAAGAATGASVLLSGFKTSANGAAGITTTAPTNWTEPTNGDQTTAVGSTARQAAAETSVRTGQTGTITPGAETASLSSFGIVHHAFAIEQTPQPTVDAGADATVTGGGTFSRTATENLNGGTATSRAWTIQAGPTGVGNTLGTAAALSWTPTVGGTYTLRYTLVASNGTVTDDVIVTVYPPNLVGYATVVGNTSPITVTKANVNAALGGTVTDGDLLVAVLSDDETYSLMAASTGTWTTALTLDAVPGGSGAKVKVFLRTAASEPVSWDFATGVGDAVATVIALRGRDTTLANAVGAIQQTVAGTSRVTPTVDHAGIAGSILLAGATIDSNGIANTWTPPTEMMELADAQSTTWASHSVAILPGDPADPTGTYTFTYTTSALRGDGIQWALVAPPSGGAPPAVRPRRPVIVAQAVNRASLW